MIEAYQEVATRLGILPKAQVSEHKGPVLVSENTP